MLIYIANLIAITMFMYLLGKLTEVEGRAGYMYSVYPWITTFPETLSTTLYVLHGYNVTALYNSVFSATFDIAVVFGLVALVHGTIEFRLRDLTLLTSIAGIMFMFLLSDGFISYIDAVYLYIVLVFLIIYSIARYGFLGRGINRATALRTALAMAGLGVVTWIFTVNIIALIQSGVSQAIAGILSASLTSVPDLVIALVYGLKTMESQAQILGCVAHDFIENVPSAVIIPHLVTGIQGVVDPNPILTAVITGATIVVLLFASSYGRITRFEGAILVATFIVLSLVVCMI